LAAAWDTAAAAAADGVPVPLADAASTRAFAAAVVLADWRADRTWESGSAAASRKAAIPGKRMDDYGW
jgi:hypothetical protein